MGWAPTVADCTLLLEAGFQQPVHLHRLARYRWAGAALVRGAGQGLERRHIPFVGSLCLDGTAVAGADAARRGLPPELAVIRRPFRPGRTHTLPVRAHPARTDSPAGGLVRVRVGARVGVQQHRCCFRRAGFHLRRLGGVCSLAADVERGNLAAVDADVVPPGGKAAGPLAWAGICGLVRRFSGHVVVKRAPPGAILFAAGLGRRLPLSAD